jgi:hypothetical protein
MRGRRRVVAGPPPLAAEKLSPDFSNVFQLKPNMGRSSIETFRLDWRMPAKIAPPGRDVLFFWPYGKRRGCARHISESLMRRFP